MLWRGGSTTANACEMPHEWLWQNADYYEEVEIDHRAKDETLRTLKKCIRLKPDKVQCRETRKALPSCLGWDKFFEAWKPADLILTSRLKVSHQAQELLFQRHKDVWKNTPVPLLYHPKDSRKKKIG